jgi:hypothetical protein
MQIGYCVFDVIVLVLSCPAFCREHSTTMDVLEIAIGELVPCFGLLVCLVVDPQIPSPELIKPV